MSVWKDTNNTGKSGEESSGRVRHDLICDITDEEIDVNVDLIIPIHEK